MAAQFKQTRMTGNVVAPASGAGVAALGAQGASEAGDDPRAPLWVDEIDFGRPKMQHGTEFDNQLVTAQGARRTGRR